MEHSLHHFPSKSTVKVASSLDHKHNFPQIIKTFPLKEGELHLYTLTPSPETSPTGCP